MSQFQIPATAPVHPGDVLWKKYMHPYNISVNELARALRIPASRVLAIVKQKRRITPDTALRLARYFDVSPKHWLNLQSYYELAVAENELQATIQREVLPHQWGSA